MPVQANAPKGQKRHVKRKTEALLDYNHHNLDVYAERDVYIHLTANFSVTFACQTFYENFVFTFVMFIRYENESMCFASRKKEKLLDELFLYSTFIYR